MVYVGVWKRGTDLRFLLETQLETLYQVNFLKSIVMGVDTAPDKPLFAKISLFEDF